MTPPEADANHMCLCQGYQCQCLQCQVWIDRWSKELDAFATIDSMMRDGKSLFQIYERLRAAHPDMLCLYHATVCLHEATRMPKWPEKFSL